MSFRLFTSGCLLALVTATLPIDAQTRSRRNFYGMHNLKDGGAPIPEGMNWTRHLVGEGGYVFDWVRGDYGQWVVDAMDRDLIPVLRVQNCNGGCDPDPGHPEIVASVIRDHLAAHRPEYLDRLVYLQLWNEPGDPRDFVTPEDFADFLVAAHSNVQRADTHDVFRTMTPGQNGSEWWRRAIRHNPAVCQAFDVWATHPYPESYPPHYNHHDGVPYINQVKTIDSYLLDLDAVVSECEAHGSPRRGFPVMITETAYGDHLGISFEGYPKTTRGGVCTTDGPCEFLLASQYNRVAFTEFWHRWPEVIAVHPFILQNWSWDHFAWVNRGSQSRNDQPVPDWCPPEDILAATPWPPGYNAGAKRCGMPQAIYPQYKAILDVPKPPPADFEPYRGPVGVLRGRVTRQGTGEPVRFATLFTDGYEFGGPTMSDGIYVVRDVPIGDYTLTVDKVGYRSESRAVRVEADRETVVDFDLVFEGRVSKGIYFQNQGTCHDCDLFAPFLGQTITLPDDVGFIKFAAAMPNVGGATMKFSIHEGGPTGPRVGTSVTAFPEWGGEMIGAEWPGDGVPVTPGGNYFLRIERDDGGGVYLFATDSDPYPGGMAFTGTTPHPTWDLFATVRGKTVAVGSAVGTVVGSVRDEGNAPLSGAAIRVEPGELTATSSADGSYSLVLSEGVYSLTAMLEGYEPMAHENVSIVEGQTVVLDFTLTSRSDPPPPPPPPTSGLITNGDFTAGLDGWSTWVERGALSPTVDGNGRLHLRAVGHNGGVYQQFATGGPGTEIAIKTFLASSPTVSQSQWAEVLVIDGPRLPADGQDANANQPDVVLVHKRDTWDHPSGWSESTAIGTFTASSDVATVVLKSGNLLGVDSGTLFDDLVVEAVSSGPPPPSNRAPTARVDAAPKSGEAPLEVSFDASASSDPDGDSLTYVWDFGDGESARGPMVTHTYRDVGTFVTTLAVDDGLGGADSESISIDVTPSAPVDNLITNADFTRGLEAWSTWVERGPLEPVVRDGRLELVAVGHNGGVYQQFATGGAGTTITIGGVWGSEPTVPNAQWAEVLVINGPRMPTNGQDLNGDQPDVVLVHKNDTWRSPDGWSGPMPSGSFVASGDVATIVLKSGNLPSVHSGTFFDDVVVLGGGTPPPANQPPTARASANPSMGAAPLTVSFDATHSSDPDGDALMFSWAFGDGATASGALATHTYLATGSFTVTVTVSDERGASDVVELIVTAHDTTVPDGLAWDPRLATLGLEVVEADVPPGTWYWKLTSAVFESDGEILPPPGGGSESNGTHSIYVKALGPDGSPIENQLAVVLWPRGGPTNEVGIRTKGAVDGFWGDFPMAGGWCPFFPDGPRGPYGARIGDGASDEVWGMGMPCNRHVSYRLTWTWSRKESTLSKLSIHAGFGGPLSMQFVERAQPRIVKILDSFSAAPEIRRVSPETEIIGRAFLASQPMDGDPVQRAREWWELNRQLVLQYPEIDYWEGYNEPIIQTPELMAWYAAFESERVRLLAEHGRRACIGNFSVGNPDLPLWPHFFPALDVAKANGGILGLHEYGTPMQQHFDVVTGEGWFTGRYRKLYRQYLIPADKVLPLAITETGVDVVPPVGWKHHFTGEEYLEQLEWYDHVLLEDDYVLGATIFALEIPGWWSFDVAPIVEPLADYVASSVQR